MRFVTAVGLVAVMGWVGGADDTKKDDKPAEKAKFDPAKLVGTWELTDGKKLGEKVPAENLKKAAFSITKDGMTLSGPEGTFKFKYKLDTKADPVKIDLEMTESPFGGGIKSAGIIKMEKDTVTLSYTPMGDTPPAKFDDDKANMFVMKKKPADAKEEPKSKTEK